MYQQSQPWSAMVYNGLQYSLQWFAKVYDVLQWFTMVYQWFTMKFETRPSRSQFPLEPFHSF